MCPAGHWSAPLIDHLPLAHQQTLASCARPTGSQFLATKLRAERPHRPRGLVTIRLRNAGRVDHQVQLARLHRGATERQFLAYVRAGDETAAYRLMDFAGGANAIPPAPVRPRMRARLRPGGTWRCASSRGPGRAAPAAGHGRDLPRGRPDGPPHTTLVRGSSDADNFGSGCQRLDPHGAYRIRDTTAADPHELTILRLAPGKTVIDSSTGCRPA